MDNIFTTIVQTAKLHGISAYAYFRDLIRRQFEMPSLAQSIQNATASGREDARFPFIFPFPYAF